MHICFHKSGHLEATYNAYINHVPGKKCNIKRLYASYSLDILSM